MKLIISIAVCSGGVIGLQDTLDALREGRIQSLVIEEGYRVPGARCTGCGYCSSDPIETCPFCGSKMEQISDVVELAVHQVMAAGGDVEVLRPTQTVEAFKKIGAILRY